ncbi:MAG: hypothetical protein V9G98_10680 [Candidatus Competibacter sp.]
MTKEVGKFQEEMLNGRLAVKAFMAKESEQAVQNYQKQLEALRAGIAQTAGAKSRIRSVSSCSTPSIGKSPSTTNRSSSWWC